MSHSTDIVAYVFNADIRCPECVAKAWRPYDQEHTLPAEVVLDRAAACIGIDRGNESSFDSGEFPKVVFADQVNDVHWDHCDSCGDCIDHDITDHPTGW